MEVNKVERVLSGAEMKKRSREAFEKEEMAGPCDADRNKKASLDRSR
jgi:hypothetical protein